MNDLLFVYGTLMRRAGHPMSQVLSAGADFVSDARFIGRLYQIAQYPGAVASTDLDEVVFGEVHRMHQPAELLHTLDAYEGCGPDAVQPAEYVRDIRPVELAGGAPAEAWIYLYNWPLAEVSRIRSGRFGV